MIRIGVAQYEPRVTNLDWNLEQLDIILNEATEEKIDVLVLPELANSGYVFQSEEEVADSSEVIPSGSFCSRLCEWSQENRLVCSGIAQRGDSGIFNSAVAFADGNHLATYEKLHLFSQEIDWFIPGTMEPPVFEWRGHRYGVMICFDWAFPEVARILALKGAQVILHPSNLVFQYCQNAMVTRSLENRIFSATSNRIGEERGISFTGVSQITAPNGELLLRMSHSETGIGFVDIDPSTADDKHMGELNDLFDKRRTGMYTRLVKDS